MWSSLKQLLPTDRDRCIIIEDGEPKYVILRFFEYQQLKKGMRYGRKEKTRDVWDEEAVNRTIAAELTEKDIEEPQGAKELEKAGLRRAEVASATQAEGLGLRGISIEDLPF
ncbi:MAG: hypothetical protein HYS15_00335 [Candidatus Spechtbacteria bacterium]|nr:hypothetical protein [Candidatus Spechtbacteria bacterium]